jgi:hypothetical protein
MDADDRLDSPNRDRLRALFASLGDENAAYLMRCVSELVKEAKSGLLIEGTVRPASSKARFRPHGSFNNVELWLSLHGATAASIKATSLLRSFFALL